jgi:hypothetical protein
MRMPDVLALQLGLVGDHAPSTNRMLLEQARRLLHHLLFRANQLGARSSLLVILRVDTATMSALPPCRRAGRLLGAQPCMTYPKRD